MKDTKRMTDVRTFKAATMQEALELVRREMGTQAIILHTRHLEGAACCPGGKSPHRWRSQPAWV